MANMVNFLVLVASFVPISKRSPERIAGTIDPVKPDAFQVYMCEVADLTLQ